MEACRLPCLLFHVACLALSSRPVLGQETLCSAQGLCYYLHPSQMNYEKAQAACGPSGELTSMKDEGERQNILLLLAQGALEGSGKFWIGLSKPVPQCVVKEKPLRGFQWVSGKEDSDVDLWAANPDGTCTTAKCVALQRPSAISEPSAWHWKEYSCSKRYPYICRREHQGVCSSRGVPRASVLTPQTHYRAANESTVFSPPGTSATAVCHSGEQNLTVTCQHQAGSYQWVSKEGGRPICPCPAGYVYRLAGGCTNEDITTAHGHRPCNQTHQGLPCDDRAGKELGPVVVGPQPGPDKQAIPHPGKGVAPQPGERASGPIERITPGPTPYGKGMIHATSASVSGRLLTSVAVNGSVTTIYPSTSSFSHVLVPVVIATVALGLVTLFVIAIFKVCFRRKGRDRKSSTAPTQGDADPEENNASSVQHPEDNGETSGTRERGQ